MAEEFDPETASSNDAYIGFLIFIKILALWSMMASTLLVRDIYHKLCNKGNNVSSKREKLSMMWNISLTQSILVCLSVGDFFRRVFISSRSWLDKVFYYLLNCRISLVPPPSSLKTVTVPFSFSFYPRGWSHPS